MIEDLSSENLLVPCWFLFHINGFVFGIFHPAWDTYSNLLQIHASLLFQTAFINMNLH